MHPPEPTQLDDASVGEKNVACFHVSVNSGQLVQVGQGLQSAMDDGWNLLFSQSFSKNVDQVRGRADTVLHHKL